LQLAASYSPGTASPPPGKAIQARVLEVSHRNPPRLTDGLIPAGQTCGAQMPSPPEVRAIADQEFTAPDRAVEAEASAVEGDPDDRLDKPVFGHAAGHVGVMML